MRELKRIFGNPLWYRTFLLFFALNIGFFLYNLERHQTLDAVSQSEEYVNGYENKLEQMEKEANRIIHLPFFQDKKSFEYRNIVKTIEDYKAMRNQKLTVGNDQMVCSLFDDGMLEVCQLVVIFCTILVIMDERRLGMEGLTLTYANGRIWINIIRIVAIILSAMLSILGYFGSRIVGSMIYFGQNMEWSRLLQSIERYQDFPVPMSIGEFLWFYCGVQLLGLVLCGLLIWCILSAIKNDLLGLSVIGIIFAISVLCNQIFSYSDKLGWLKSFNLIQFIAMKEQFWHYRNYLVGNRLWMEWQISIAIMCFSCVILAAINLLIRVRRRHITQFRVRLYRQFFDCILKKVYIPQSSFMIEGKKILRDSKVVIVLACYLLFLVQETSIPVENYEEQETYLHYYREKYEGIISEKTENQIQTEKKTLERRAQELNDHGVFQGQELRDISMRLGAIQVMQERIEIQKKEQINNVWILREQIYELVYGDNYSEERERNGLILFVTLILTLFEIFSKEWKLQTADYVKTLHGGNIRFVLHKVIWSYLLTAFLFAISTMREIYLIMQRWGGFSGWYSNGRSLQFIWPEVNGMSVGAHICWIYFFRLMWMLLSTSIFLLISMKTDSPVKSALGSFAIIIVPYIAAGRLDWIQHVSILNRYTSATIQGGIISIVGIVVVIILMIRALFGQWSRYRV